jgi:hypothetical protein
VQGGKTSPVAAVHESGYGALVLDRLATHTCGIVAADAAGVIVPDRRDPHHAFLAAGCGLGVEQVGERFEMRRGIIRDVIARARTRRLRPGADLSALTGGTLEAAATGACVPVCSNGEVRGAMWAVARRGQRFERRRLELLRAMATLTANAIDHAVNHERLEASAQASVDALAAAIDLRDGYTGDHSEEVVELSVEVGRALDLDRVALVELACAARLHDVGKIGVPDEILRKPAALTADEWVAMRRHPRAGADLLARVPGLEAVAAVVRFHHERWDGRGYPDGLAGEEIPLASRIIAVCDAFRAMTTDRPYRRRLAAGSALAELRRASGAQFDPAVVAAAQDLNPG